LSGQVFPSSRGSAGAASIVIEKVSFGSLFGGSIAVVVVVGKTHGFPFLSKTTPLGVFVVDAESSLLDSDEEVAAAVVFRNWWVKRFFCDCGCDCDSEEVSAILRASNLSMEATCVACRACGFGECYSKSGSS
jgi:hypothetical protein